MPDNDLSESEAEFIHKLEKAYPGALGYTADSDAPVRPVAEKLIADGHVNRVEIDVEGAIMASYQLSPEYVDKRRARAKEQGEAARWN